MRKTLKQRIVEQIHESSQITELKEKHPELKLQIHDIINSLVESSLGSSSKSVNEITNTALAIIEERQK